MLIHCCATVVADAGLSDIEFIANKPERLRVLSGDPAGYGAEGARVFAIYENFPV